MDLVWRRLCCGGGELLLALAIADFANDDGRSIFPSVETLSAKTRQARRTVQRQLAMFRECDWLLVEGSGRGGRRMTTRYAINPDWIRGANLARFPDRNSAIHGIETAPSTTQNRATAMAHDPSGSVSDPSPPPISPSAARKGNRAKPSIREKQRARRRSASAAWDQVTDVRRGRRRSPLSEINSLAFEVLDGMGGMFTLENTASRDVPALKKRFLDEYQSRLTTQEQTS